MMRRATLSLAAIVLIAAPLDAQRIRSARTSVLFESYSFGSGLLIDNITQLTVPVVVDLVFGRSLGVTLSGGFTSVELQSTNENELADQKLSGALDTEFRLTFDAVPGRLVLIATGAAPSGTKSVARAELSILGALSSDLIGFSASNVGSGGNVGGGLVGAFPLGRWAVGYGATYRQSFSYEPLQDAGDTTLTPGGELRVRTGIEGPLARRTYLRFAGIVAVRAKDEINSRARHGIGNRYIGYLAVNHGIGSGALTLYGFDVFRADPQIESSAAGAAFFPRGNLLAAGARLDVGGRNTRVVPRVEYRLSAAAADTTDTTLRRAGQSVRFGADVRHQFSRQATVVLQGSGIVGDVVQAGENVRLSGFRAGVNLEIRP